MDRRMGWVGGEDRAMDEVEHYELPCPDCDGTATDCETCRTCRYCGAALSLVARQQWECIPCAIREVR